MAALLVTTTTTPAPAVAGTVPLPLEATPRCSADTGQRPDSAAKWKEEAQSIPLGTKIKIKTTSGETLKGVLRSAGDSSVTIELEKRNPVSPVEVPYSSMRAIERPGLGWGVKIAIIAGITVIVGAIINSKQCSSGC
jgi:hypothetical protein